MKITQSFYTLAYYKLEEKMRWKSFLGCGKVRGKRAKLQQNRERIPLFHASRGWISGKWCIYFTQMPKMGGVEK